MKTLAEQVAKLENDRAELRAVVKDMAERWHLVREKFVWRGEVRECNGVHPDASADICAAILKETA